MTHPLRFLKFNFTLLVTLLLALVSRSLFAEGPVFLRLAAPPQVLLNEAGSGLDGASDGRKWIATWLGTGSATDTGERLVTSLDLGTNDETEIHGVGTLQNPFSFKGLRVCLPKGNGWAVKLLNPSGPSLTTKSLNAAGDPQGETTSPIPNVESGTAVSMKAVRAVSPSGAEFTLIIIPFLDGRLHPLQAVIEAPNGELTSFTLPTPSGANVELVSVCQTAGGWIVAWTNQGQLLPNKIFTQFVSLNGDTSAPLVEITSPKNFDGELNLVPLGMGLLVVWGERRTENGGDYLRFGLRLSAAGEPLGDAFELYAAEHNASLGSLNVASRGDVALAMWTDYVYAEFTDEEGQFWPTGATMSVLRRIPSQGALPPPQRKNILPAQTQYQTTDNLVLPTESGWQIIVQRSAGTYAMAYNADATQGRPITFGKLSPQVAPAVACNGKEYLVVWEESRLSNSSQVYAARYSLQGRLIQTQALSAATGNDRSPSVNAVGDTYLIAWSHRPAESPASIQCCRWAPGTAPTAPEVIDFAGEGTVKKLKGVRVASDGSVFLVVCERDRFGGFPSQARGRFISPDGMQLGSAFVIVDGGGIGSLAVAGSQGKFIVGWRGTVPLAAPLFYQFRVLYSIVNAIDQTVSAPTVIPTVALGSMQQAPYATASHDNFALTWRETPLATPDTLDVDAVSRAVRIGRDGALLDPQGIPISTSQREVWEPALIAHPNSGGYTGLWISRGASPGDETKKIWARRLTNDLASHPTSPTQQAVSISGPVDDDTLNAAVGPDGAVLVAGLTNTVVSTQVNLVLLAPDTKLPSLDIVQTAIPSGTASWPTAQWFNTSASVEASVDLLTWHRLTDPEAASWATWIPISTANGRNNLLFMPAAGVGRVFVRLSPVVE